jgi:hypothetical protein
MQLYLVAKTKAKYIHGAPMNRSNLQKYALPSRVLFGLGLYDLLRGFMHTFLLR